MPPVRRHRIGKEMPSVIHPDPDPAAINLCQDLAVQTDVEAVVLFGSRATGGWDERSDLDVIIVHPSAAGREAETAIRRVLHRIRERHYPGCWDHESSYRGVRGGQQVVSLDYYASYRRTMNDVMARAAREGRIFTKEPNAADRFRHDGNVSNEWELVTLERLHRAVHVLQNIVFMRGNARWYAQGDQPDGRQSFSLHTDQGREAHELLWNLGAALLSILGVIYPRDSVAEMATAIARYDAGWSHAWRSDLDRIDQYSGYGCAVVVIDPIDDVPALWRDLEVDRDALWERIRQLSGHDLAAAQPFSARET